MKETVVTAKNGKEEGSPSASVTIQVPETLDEARQMYGDAAILSNAMANGIITLQAGIRRELKAGKTQAEIAAKLSGWKLGVAVERSAVDPKAAFLARFAAMTPEEQAAEIKKLQEVAKGKK
jgi:hypothetical protein